MSRSDLIKIALVAVILVLAVVLSGKISNSQQSAESEIVRQSIKDAAINCYAVERSRISAGKLHAGLQ